MGRKNKRNEPAESSSSSMPASCDSNADSNLVTSASGSGSSDGSHDESVEPSQTTTAASAVSAMSITTSHTNASCDDDFDRDQAPFYQLIAVETLEKLKQHYIDSKWMQDPSKNPNMQTKIQWWDELLTKAKTHEIDAGNEPVDRPKAFYEQLLSSIEDMKQTNKNTMKHKGNGEGNFGIFCWVAKDLLHLLQRFQDQDSCQQWLAYQLGESLTEAALNNLKNCAGNFFGLDNDSKQSLKDDKAALAVASLLKDYWFNKEIQQALSSVQSRFSESFWNKLNYLLGDSNSKQPQKMGLVFERINYLLQIRQHNTDKSSEYYNEQVMGALTTAKERNNEIEAKDSTYWQKVNKLGQNCYETFFSSEDKKQRQSLEQVINQIKQQINPEHTATARAAP